MKQRKFKVGDRVKINAASCARHGRTGIIRSVQSWSAVRDDMPYAVYFDDTQMLPFDEHELVLDSK